MQDHWKTSDHTRVLLASSSDRNQKVLTVDPVAAQILAVDHLLVPLLQRLPSIVFGVRCLVYGVR
jgi:hypothetical protein